MTNNVRESFGGESDSDSKEDFEAENGAENVETLSDRIHETQEFVSEIERSNSALFNTERLAVDFGLDELSRRYSLEKTLAVTAQATSKMRKEMAQPRKGLDKFKDDSRFAADAITSIYSQLEPDASKRKELYAEMTAVKPAQETITHNGLGELIGRSVEYDEDGNNKMRLSTTLFPDKNGDLRVYKSGKSGSLNNIAAYEGLYALGNLAEEINNPNSLVFGENIEQAKAEGKTPAEQLVADIENPGLLDLLGRVEGQLVESAKLADEQIEAQKEEIETRLNAIEKRIVDEVRDEVEPFEVSRSSLAEQMITMDDDAGRTILEEASKKMYGLILDKTSEASQKYHQEKADYYTSLGEGVESFLIHSGKSMKKLANQPTLYYAPKRNA